MYIEKDDIAKLFDAKDIICQYCDSQCCESCMVQKIANDVASDCEELLLDQ